MRLKRLDFQEIKQSVLEKFQYVNMKIGHFIRQTAQRLSLCSHDTELCLPNRRRYIGSKHINAKLQFKIPYFYAVNYF